MLYPISCAKRLKLAIFILIISLIHVQGFATIYYVKPTATGSGNGSSWSNASASIQTMINLASSGDQIWVARGTYTAPYTVDGPSFYYSFVLKNGIAMYGGFTGSETSINERNYQNNETILAGNGYTVVKALGSISRATIVDGFSIINGSGGSGFTDYAGGLVITTLSSPTVQHCKFYNNTTSNNTGGGAIALNNYSNPLIIDCSFYNNSAINGGAIYANYYIAAEIINCSFYNNTASSGSGNAIYIGPNTNNAKITKIANSILYGNGNNEIYESSTGFLTVDYSNIRGGYSSGTGNINTDPLFENASTGNLKLKYNSPSVQTGDNATYSAYANINTSLDLASNFRLSNNLTNTGSNIDMGAYQYIVTAPSNLTYTSPNIFTVNVSSVNLTPTVSGTPTSSFAIDKTLPAGLTFNTSTGAITGIPSQIFTPTIYTVSTSNIAGTTSGSIRLTVNENRPNLSYTSPVSYTIGQTISPTLVPVNVGGEVTGGLIDMPFVQSLGSNAMTKFVFDNLGNMFILKEITGEVYKRTPDGTMSLYASGVSAPEGITIDPVGNLYVISSVNQKLYKVDVNGQTSIINQNAEGNFISPRGISYSNDGSIYIADVGSDKIIKVDIVTGTQTVIASNVAPSNVLYTGPSTLVFDANNDLIVFNADNTISKVTLAGVVTQNYINTSDASLNYSYPNDVAKDADGNIYINSTGNTSRIYKINSIGDITSFSTLNVGPHLLKGIKFNSSGELFLVYRQVGTNFSQLYKYIRGKYIINPSLPSGLSFDNNTGIISGTPTAITPVANYTIAATNTGGTYTTTVNLEVKGTITYSSPNTYTKGTTISTLTPNTNSVSATTFTISPTLPTGLSLNSTNGEISGTPTAILAETEFVVNAQSNTGNLIGKLKITVIDIPPTNLSYTTPNIYTRSVVIGSLTPSVSGGPVVTYSIIPNLPDGLSLNTSTGYITGTPTTISVSKTYTVTATNTGGSSTTNIRLTVNDLAPTNLLYASPKVYTKGTTIALLSPTSTGGSIVSYSVNPSLPTGLTLNTSNGNISGNPSIVVASAIYTITATNSGGSTSFGINITVNDVPPSGLTYSTPNTFFKDKASNGLTPNQSGGGVVTNYTITPSLPTGLTFDAITGVVSGTSSILSDPTNYTVTASNSGGSTTAVLNIKVILFLFAKDSIIQHNNCINDSIGQILITAEGGYAPYSFAVNNGVYQSTGLFKNLPSGIYRFSLKDATGSVVNITDTIKTLSNVPIKIYVSQTNNKCFNDSLGKIIVDSVTGGVGPLSYLWSGGTVVSNGIIKLPKGVYKLNVKDFYGCEDSVSISITEPAKLVSTVNVTQPSCYNQCNGVLTITSTGGTGNYVYLWNNGAVTSVINNLCSGVYSVTVKDSLGCFSINTVNLINPLPFKVELDSLVTICANQVYKKDVKNTNYPTAKFAWTSNNGYTSNSSLLSVNKAGTYIVKSENLNGCLSSDSIVIKMQQSNIESVFAVATNVFKNDTIHIVNISMPRPEKSIWTYTIDSAVKLVYKNEDSLRLKFTNEGTYSIQLNTVIGSCMDSSIQIIHVLNTNDINRYTIEPLGLNSIQDLVIAPNPNRGQFNVSLKLRNTSSIAIRIMNISNGKLVYSNKYPSATSFNIPFNLLLSADVYALIIETEFGAVSVSKILIL